jgi:hypothetical protein
MQGGIVFDADLQFLVDVFQPPLACHVHSVENEADLQLQNVIAVFAIGHPQAWLHVFLLLPRDVPEPFFVCFAHLLTHVPQFDLQLLVAVVLLRVFDDLNVMFCEALL